MHTQHSIKRAHLLSTLLTLLLSVIGIVAFLYPFFFAALAASDAIAARATDAPIIFGLLMPLVLLLIVAELGGRHMNAKIVAVLGVLTAINALLRFPTSLGDSPTFFFLPMLVGYVYGARFGFLHGVLSLLISALLTVGIGPWLPFQMLAMGWLGMGAASIRWLRLPAGTWQEIAALTVYGYIAAMLFGALLNLYFWPFLGTATGLAWQPGLGLRETLQRYWTFYVVSQSLPWDALRAISTATLIVLLGRPLLRELRRFHDRFFWLADVDDPFPHSSTHH